MRVALIYINQIKDHFTFACYLDHICFCVMFKYKKKKSNKSSSSL